MADFVVDYEKNRRAEALGLEVLPATWAEGFGAALEETLARNPTAGTLREGDRAQYYDREYYDEFGQHHVIPAKPSTLLSTQEANERYGIEGRLTFDEATPEPVARQLNQLKVEEILRQDTRRRSTAGIGAELTAGILGSMADPLNIFASFIPVVGAARFAAIAGRVGTTVARGTKGVVEGAIGAAALEPLVYASAQWEQADYTAYDSLMNLTFGSVMGGGLHIGAGYIGDRWAGRAQASPVARQFDDLPMEYKADVLTTAARQIEEGRPVDIAPVMDTATAHAESRGFLQPHELQIREFREKASSAGLTQEQMDALLPKDVRDPVTGFYKAEDRIPTLERAMNYITNTREPGVYVEADVANLGGLNARFGHSEANKIYRDMAGIFQDAIREAGGTGILFRHGGDEISAIVIGVPDSAVERALAGMQDRIKGVESKYGAGDIPLAKDKTLPPGTRLNYGTAEIRPGRSLDSVMKEADRRVEAWKKGESGVEAGPVGGRVGTIERADTGTVTGNQGGGSRAGYGVRRAPDAEAVKTWLEQQSRPHVDSEISAAMQAAEANAKREAGAPKEVEQLIADAESELADIGRMLTEEDYTIYGVDLEEGGLTAKGIEALEQEESVYQRIYEQAVTCLTGKR